MKGDIIEGKKDGKLLQSNNLIKDIKSGNLSSFQALFEQWKTPIYNFVAKMIGNQMDSEDITQEVFLTVYKKIHTLKDEKAFKPWLYTIAKRSTFNWIRKHAKSNKNNSADANDKLIANDYTPEEEAMSLEFEKIIQANLNKMNPNFKLAFVLRVYNELDYKEIASITGWPLSKVKMNIHRARLIMRNKLKPFIKEQAYGL